MRDLGFIGFWIFVAVEFIGLGAHADGIQRFKA